MSTYGLKPAVADYSQLTLADTHPSFADYISAAGAQTLRDSPTSSLYRAYELATAGGETISADTARGMAAETGVKVDFGDGPTTRGAANIMIDRAFRARRREATIQAYNPNVALALGTTFLTSVADPVNVGLAFIPFVGEARYAAMLGRAATMGERALVRAGVGAADGFGGAALAEPLIAAARYQEGGGYEAADTMRNLAFGTAFGSGLHVGTGAVRDALRRKAAPASGHVEPAQTPADIVDRVPLEVKETALRAAISDLVSGRAVQASEVIDVTLRDNPDIAVAVHKTGTLRRGGPELSDTEGRIAFWEQRLSKGFTGPQTLTEWIVAQGGVRDTAGAIRAAIGEAEVPSELLVKQKGVKATKRGMELDALVAKAQADGFPVTGDDIVKTLHDPETGKRVKPTEVDAGKAHAEELAHNELAAKEAGVNPKTRPNSKARAIVAWEQKIAAAEKSRVAAAVDALSQREADYTAGLTRKAEPVKPVELPPGEAIAAPDTAAAPVPIVVEPISTAKPIKATIDERARQFAPAEFAERDTLKTQAETFRKWLAELGVLRTVETEAEIAALKAKPVSPKNRKQRQAKLDDLEARRHIEGSTDTPDMMRIRAELVKADLRLRELAPLISKALRKAGKQVADEIGDVVALAKAEAAATATAPKAEAPGAPKADTAAAPKQATMRERADNPPAPRDALTVAELTALAEQHNQVKAFAERKLAELAAHIDPDQMQGLRDIVARLRGDNADYETVVNSAVQCLLAP